MAGRRRAATLRIAAIIVVFYHLADTTGIENDIPHGHLPSISSFQ
jgi:hypothetical protein